MFKIFLYPFLMCMIIIQVIFWVADFSGRSGTISNKELSYILSTNNVFYLISCLSSGYILTKHNSKKILIISILSIMCTSLVFLSMTAFKPMLITAIFFGASCGFFFNSFQMSMRAETHPGNLSESVCKYTLAWSSGLGFGYLLSGIFIGTTGVLGLAILIVIACLSVVYMVYTHKYRDSDLGSAEDLAESSDELSQVDLRFIFIAWSLCFSSCICIRPILAFLPKFYASAGNPAWMAGSLFFCLQISQGIVGFFAYKFKRYLYRFLPLMILQLCIISLLFMFWLFQEYIFVLISMILMGGMLGIAFFSTVYYVSNSPNKPYNVAINEAVVGVSGVIGYFITEKAIAHFNTNNAIYFSAMSTVFIILVVQTLWLSFKKPYFYKSEKVKTL